MGTGYAVETEAKVPVDRDYVKPRKMNWFKRMIINWVREDWEHAGANMPSNRLRVPEPLERETPEQDPKLNFRVYSAIGGTIVEFRRIDRKIDRSESTLYIIGKDEDFGEKIARIATLEHMK